MSAIDPLTLNMSAWFWVSAAISSWDEAKLFCANGPTRSAEPASWRQTVWSRGGATKPATTLNDATTGGWYSVIGLFCLLIYLIYVKKTYAYVFFFCCLDAW